MLVAMRALEFDGTNAKMVDRPDPELTEGRAIVRMTRAGICNTDLEIARGYMGFRGVLGHELVGVVEQGPPVWLGKRVTAEINFACGDDENCLACADGLGRHCPKRTVMGILGADGAFAERVSVPVANLHVVPDGISDDHAVFTEPLAAAFEILEQVRIEGGTRCCVLGDGKLGLLVAQVLASTGAHVLAVGKHEDKLSVLVNRGIPAVTFDAFARRRRQFDVVVEATGSVKGFEAAVAATRPRGTLILKSTVADAVAMKLAVLVIDEITVIGSRCGRFTPAIEALDAGTVDVTPLVAARFTLDRAPEALALAGERGVLKVLLEP